MHSISLIMGMLDGVFVVEVSVVELRVVEVFVVEEGLTFSLFESP